jgi:hypothetical protein
VKGEGNSQDYGMRIYDTRLGRFLSVDPITKQYPELTPYQFASNRPIDGVDLDGLERTPAGKFGQYNEIVRDNTAVQLYPNTIPVIQKQKEDAPKLKMLSLAASRPSETVQDANHVLFQNNLNNPDNIGGQSAFGIYSNMHNAKEEFKEGNVGMGILFSANAGINTVTLTGAGPTLGAKGSSSVKIEPSQQAAEEITAPKGWITQTSKKGGGTIFKDPDNPHNIIRQMPGNPNSPNLLQQNPYVKFMKEGKFYDINGKVLPNGDVPRAHIPLNQFNINNMPKF